MRLLIQEWTAKQVQQKQQEQQEQAQQQQELEQQLHDTTLPSRSSAATTAAAATTPGASVTTMGVAGRNDHASESFDKRPWLERHLEEQQKLAEEKAKAGGNSWWGWLGDGGAKRS